jgi:two-component system cell cycle response regulator
MRDARQHRVILMDPNDESREVMVRRLSAQGFAVEAFGDPAAGADAALSSPPSAVVADLWMPSISGVQLCRLLNAEPATAEVPVILRSPSDDPRSRFWAERAGAVACVAKGRMGALVRALTKAAAASKPNDGFFMHLSGGSSDVRDRIARHLDMALFDSVIAAEVRALGSCGSFERLFDSFSQFLSQVASYRWMALSTTSPDQFALHHHPRDAATAEQQARAALGLPSELSVLCVADEDTAAGTEGPSPIVRPIPFGAGNLGSLALAPTLGSEADGARLVNLAARELGGPLRMAALMDESQRLATIDPLTGLMNRRALRDALQAELAHAVRYARPLSLLLLDVDHFKHVNDTYGHGVGDQVLSAIGELLRRELRVPDLPARWGGEEFVVLLKSTDLVGAGVAAERIRSALQKLEISITAGPPLKVTASLGAAEIMPGLSAEGLIERADQAMYQAKVSGRNRVVLATAERTAPTPVPVEAVVHDATIQ